MEIKKVSAVLRTVLPLKYCGAVIVAAGSASRMGGIDKVMAELDGEPMICRTVRAFQIAPSIREIVIVTAKHWNSRERTTTTRYSVRFSAMTGYRFTELRTGVLILTRPRGFHSVSTRTGTLSRTVIANLTRL